MKITLDIPDTVVCAFFSYVDFHSMGASMGVRSISTDELKESNTIKVNIEKDGANNG